LELSNLDEVVEKPTGEITAPEHWAVYLRDLDKRWKINEILECEEGIAMASEALMTISQQSRTHPADERVQRPNGP
jgi:hypothetical protein